MSEVVKWMSTLTDCNWCHGEFGDVMYDAKVPWAISWGNFCQGCFDELGCEIGYGRGQKYERNDQGEYILTAGDYGQ